MDLMWIPVHRSWRLNERHYGALQGLNKAETAAKFGEQQVKIWRRSYADAAAGAHARRRAPSRAATLATRASARANSRSPSRSRTRSRASCRTGTRRSCPPSALAAG